MKKGVTDNPQTISDILDKADVLWLALTDDDGPHCVPVNFAEEDGIIYIHSSKKGRKATCLNSGNTVAFSAAIEIEMKMREGTACDQSYRFKSIMGSGSPRELKGDDKMHGLDLITCKLLGKQLSYTEKMLPITAVYAIDIDTVTARIKE